MFTIKIRVVGFTLPYFERIVVFITFVTVQRVSRRVLFENFMDSVRGELIMIQDRRFALYFRLCAFLFAVAGLLKQIGAFGGAINFNSFMYYTIQSNLLAILFFAFLTIRTAKGLREGRKGTAGWHSRLGMVCAVDLLVTLIVFWALLAPQDIDPKYLWTFENMAVHAITPLLCLLDYIFFSNSHRLKYRDVYYICIFPVCYVAFTSISGLMGHVYYYVGVTSGPLSSHIETVPVRFPYFFLDYDRLGMMAMVYSGVILIFIIMLGHIFYLIDHKVRKPSASIGELRG